MSSRTSLLRANSYNLAHHQRHARFLLLTLLFFFFPWMGGYPELIVMSSYCLIFTIFDRGKVQRHCPLVEILWPPASDHYTSLCIDAYQPREGMYHLYTTMSLRR
ncbi:hypothetical protein BDN70DRAFT_115367 [Pholiota conissans]|uniref:Uncharacterized protein n=1 Tax=Pholiota conissans TaxID=109636 RepID=A0A9P5YZ33_9AGAR|nr:hypothetical protein BDN70DRAFT_115367 [Pholiota conissans]